MFQAKFLQSDSTTTPKSKMFARRLEARRALSSTDEQMATLPVMVVSPELFATMVPGVADLKIADPEPTIEAASTPATKVKKSGRKRKNELSGSTSRKRSS